MATPILMPRQGQSVESCILIEWKVKAGDTVKVGDAVASIETDKAVFDIESPADGTIVELFFEEGADVPVLTHIGAVGEAGEDVSALRPEADAPAAATVEQKPETSEPKPEGAGARPIETETQPTSAATPPQAELSGRPAETAGSSPRARKRAEKEGVDAAALSGTGPYGRVIERDVIAAAAARGRMSPAAQATAADKGFQAGAGTGPGGMVLTADLRAAAAAAEPKTIPVKGVRKLIGERMHASLSSTAQLTLNRSFDATAIQVYRTKVKQQGEQFGITSITINDLIVYATLRTLLRYPELNAHFLGDRIVQFPNINMGIAVDTPRGLMVPVVKGAEQKTLGELSRTIRPLADACVEGEVQPDQLSGGTFTITNLGVLGIETFTPVLNAPEVGILGVGGFYLKPVQGENGVEHRSAINLSLTIDHQAVDGAPGARFLQDLAVALENIELLLSERVCS